MFEGRNVSLRQVARNQYEYRTPYTLVRKTYPEIDAMLDEQRAEARRSLMEIAVAKERLRAAAEAEANTSPAVTVLAPAMPKPLASEITAPPEPAPKPRAARAKTRTETHVVNVALAVPDCEPANDNAVAAPKAPKRKHGLAYLAYLEQQRAS